MRAKLAANWPFILIAFAWFYFAWHLTRWAI